MHIRQIFHSICKQILHILRIFHPIYVNRSCIFYDFSPYICKQILHILQIFHPIYVNRSCIFYRFFTLYMQTDLAFSTDFLPYTCKQILHSLQIFHPIYKQNLHILQIFHPIDVNRSCIFCRFFTLYTVKPLIRNTSEEFIKCRLDNFSMSFILYYVNFRICENK